MQIILTESQFINMVSDLTIFQMLQHAITQFTRWHHYTTGYAEHEALGDFYTMLQSLQDELIEVYIGINGRTSNEDFGMKYNKYSKGRASLYLKHFVQKMYELKDKIPHGDIQNLLDEIIAQANKTQYLLTLS